MQRVKIKEKTIARALRVKGRSYSEIANELGVSKSSISLWVRDIRITPVQEIRIRKLELQGKAKGLKKILSSRKPSALKTDSKYFDNRYQVSNFFNEWTPSLAYVLGYFAADGCMYHSRNGGFYNGGYYIEFVSIDRALIVLVRNLIGAINKIENKVIWQGGDRYIRRKQYKLRLVNKKAYQSLLGLGFTPAKSLTLTFPNVPGHILSDFVRGYFDGDGYVYHNKHRNKSKKKIIQTGFTSGSKDFLKVLQDILQKMAGMGKGSLHRHGTNWELSYSLNDSRQLYNFMYSTTTPCLKRKRVKFEEFFNNYGPVE